MCPIDFDWQIVRSILQEETKDVREVYTYTVIKISNKHFIQSFTYKLQNQSPSSRHYYTPVKMEARGYVP